MENEDLDDISSFATQPQQKGLLTFYEEQWTLQNSNQFSIFQRELTLPSVKKPLKTIDAQYDTERSQKSNPSFYDSNKLPLTISKSCHKRQKSYEISKNLEKQSRLKEKMQSANTSMIVTIARGKQKQKQNRIKTIEANIFNNITINEKMKKDKIVSQLPIHNYPFNEQEEDITAISKLKHQVAGIRLKKGSSFRGFYRQNIAVIANSLNKDILSQIELNSKFSDRILTKLQGTYEKYINGKALPRYMFPIMNPGMISLRKNDKDLNKTEPENKLQEFCTKIRSKVWRNSQSTVRTDNFC